MENISSWGLLSNDSHEVAHIFDQKSLKMSYLTEGKHACFGAGRSYGDSCLNSGFKLLQFTKMDKFLAFDSDNGILTCEPGVLLGTIQEVMYPKGWMLSVTPGTQYVTVAGAVANDVHGKNHHGKGTFGDHVVSLVLYRSSGEIIHCSKIEHPELFAATIGGIGLTGVIVSVSFALTRVNGPWIDSESIAFSSLDEFFELSKTSELEWEHSVAWIDCLAKKSVRGIFMRGKYASSNVHKKTKRSFNVSVPFTPPVSLINKLSLRIFNEVYYQSNKLSKTKQLVHYSKFFYPLDNIGQWNKIYGKKGFYQYQCVIPMDVAYNVVPDLLKVIAQSNMGSFLAVLKTFGDFKHRGILSFPMHGVTLALDFPNQNSRTEVLFNQLDQIVKEAKGRIYLAKDARMSKAMFESGYGADNINRFCQYRDPAMSTSLSRRLLEF